MANIYRSFTHKMAAKASWHRNYVTVTVCIVSQTRELLATQCMSLVVARSTILRSSPVCTSVHSRHALMRTFFQFHSHVDATIFFASESRRSEAVSCIGQRSGRVCPETRLQLMRLSGGLSRRVMLRLHHFDSLRICGTHTTRCIQQIHDKSKY